MPFRDKNEAYEPEIRQTEEGNKRKGQSSIYS